MFIIEITLDGFKSYQKETVLRQLDRNFNAITGLNGSGKSNVLDALCFILGIQTLKKVRVSNQQELIYKRGNAGITKALVTVVFDNRDKRTSPPLMRESDKIVISRQIFDGKSKFLLNGRVETAERIRSMFMSVQLNINNPHFMVMQGRITEVINMKPTQILSLVEEASGTSHYEHKKLASLNLIQRKQLRVDEVTNIVLQEIAPKLEKLSKEKQLLNRFKTKEVEMEDLKKRLVAFDYLKSAKLKEERREQIEKLKAQGEELVLLIDKDKVEIHDLEECEIIDKKNEMTKVRLKFEELDQDYNRIEKDLIVKRSNLKNNERAIQENESVQAKLARYSEEIVRMISKNKQRREESQNMARQLRREYELKKEQVKSVLLSLNDLDGGRDINLNQAIGLKEQLVETQKNLEQSQANLRSNKALLIRLERARAEAKENLEKIRQTNEEIKARIHKLSAIKKSRENSLLNSRIKISEETLKLTEILRLEEQSRSLEKQLEDLLQLPLEGGTTLASQLVVDYQPPCATFNRSLIKGRVIKLLNVKEKRFHAALEQIAGPNLYSIIVEKDITASLLLKNNCFLKHRVNLIPLDSISIPPPVDMNEVLAYAKKVSTSMVWDALSVIEFNPLFENAFKFIFGNVLICQTEDVAKKLAFDPRVSLRCVTLDGALFDPEGIISAGNDCLDQLSLRPSAIQRCGEVQKCEDDIASTKKKLEQAKKALEEVNRRNEEWHDLKRSIDVQEHQIQKLKEQYDNEGKDLWMQRIANLDEDIKETQVNINLHTEYASKYEADIAQMTEEMKEFNQSTDRRREILEDMLEKLKVEVERVSNDLKTHQKIVDKLEYESEQKEKQLVESREQLVHEQAEKDRFLDVQGQLKKNIEEYTQLKVSKRERMKELQVEQQEIRFKIKEKNAVKEKVMKRRDINLLEVRRIDAKIDKFTLDRKDLIDRLRKLEVDNPWVLTERHHFGDEATPKYFFDATFDQKENTINYYRLKEEVDKLRKRVNVRVDEQATQAESEYTDLIKKKDRIMADKEKIEAAIKELDSLKNAALEATFAKVNMYFSSIFSTLLPGAQAKLERVSEQFITEGVQLRVGFSNIWKDNLSQLSGGQRSLLALSFILSLLKFRPAPIYILDEIDAALDMSHTTNIGKMISEHFQNSQFLIISLKEEFFKNANVLYKIEFHEGRSIVRRSENVRKKQKSSLQLAEARDHPEQQ